MKLVAELRSRSRNDGLRSLALMAMSIFARASAGLAQLLLILAVTHRFDSGSVKNAIGAVAIANLGAVFVRLGADNTYLMLISRNNRDHRAAIRMVNEAMCIRAITLFVLAWTISLCTTIYGTALIPVAVAAAAIAACGQYQLVLASLGKPVLAPLLTSSLPILIVVAGVLMGAITTDAHLALSLAVAAAAAAIASALIAAKKVAGNKPTQREPKGLRNERAILLSFIQQLMVWLPTAISAATLPAASVAALAVAFRVGGGLTLGTNALSSSSVKSFADSTSAARWPDLSTEIGKVQRISALIGGIGVAAYLLILATAPTAAGVTSPADGVASGLVVLAYAFVALCGPLTMVLVMLGRTSEVLSSVLKAACLYAGCVAFMWAFNEWSAVALAAATLAYALVVNGSNLRSMARWRAEMLA